MPAPLRAHVALPALSLAVLVLCTACHGGNAASQLAVAPEFHPKDQTKCGVVRSQDRPLVVEWPSADRLTLENKIRQGVVAVRYVGCEVEVLERCSAPARYGYLGATRSEDKVVVRDADDLYANLPVGAAALEAKLQRSGQLTVAMDLVGRYEAERPVVRFDELQGECTGATHFVYGAAVGAFDFYAGADATVGAGAGVGAIGAGASSQAQRETLTRNGDVAACAKASSADKAPPDGCGALVRIELVPLSAGGPPAAASAAPSASAAPAEPPLTTASSVHPGSMVRIPAGSFMMGSPEGEGRPDEQPRHKVSVASFQMDVTEVTVSAYALCVRAGGCAPASKTVDWPGITDEYRKIYDQFCNAERDDRPDHPINCVDRNAASAYCAWSDKRLPTEEEWEFAARGPEGRTYPWGSSPPAPNLLNACGHECVAAAKELGQTWSGMYAGSDRAPFTAPVGSFPEGRTPSGLYDMAGNLWEWTSSGYSGDYSKPRSDKARVYRGGGWASFDPGDARAMHRGKMPPSSRGHGLGFRCAK